MAIIQIRGVTHQRQLNPRACWYTCLQMEVRYFQDLFQASLAGLSEPDNFPEMQKRFQDGSNPSWAEWRDWAQKCGFTPMDYTPTQSGVYNLLSRNGPIIYSGTWGFTFNGHVVIITGIDTDNGVLYIDNPLDASAPSQKDYNTFMGNLSQTLWENPLFVY